MNLYADSEALAETLSSLETIRSTDERYVCICICMYVLMHVCNYVCMYVCMLAYAYACVGTSMHLLIKRTLTY